MLDLEQIVGARRRGDWSQGRTAERIEIRVGWPLYQSFMIISEREWVGGKPAWLEVNGVDSPRTCPLPTCSRDIMVSLQLDRGRAVISDCAGREVYEIPRNRKNYDDYEGDVDHSITVIDITDGNGHLSVLTVDEALQVCPLEIERALNSIERSTRRVVGALSEMNARVANVRPDLLPSLLPAQKKLTPSFVKSLHRRENPLQ